MKLGHWSEAVKVLPEELTIFCYEGHRIIGAISQQEDDKFSVAYGQREKKKVVSADEIGATIREFELPEDGWTLYQ